MSLGPLQSRWRLMPASGVPRNLPGLRLPLHLWPLATQPLCPGSPPGMRPLICGSGAGWKGVCGSQSHGLADLGSQSAALLDLQPAPSSSGFCNPFCFLKIIFCYFNPWSPTFEELGFTTNKITKTNIHSELTFCQVLNILDIFNPHYHFKLMVLLFSSFFRWKTWARRVQATCAGWFWRILLVFHIQY